MADYSEEMMHASLDINLPNYASAIVTNDEIVQALSGSHSSTSEVAGVDGAR